MIGVAELEGRRLAGIADAKCKTFERQLQNVAEGFERLREGRKKLRGQLRNLRGRKQGDRSRLIDGIGAGTLLVFPLPSELHAMRAVLPGKVVGKDVAAKDTRLGRVGLIAECQTGAFHLNVRAEETHAVGALVSGRQVIPIAPKSRGVAELIHL